MQYLTRITTETLRTICRTYDIL